MESSTCLARQELHPSAPMLSVSGPGALCLGADTESARAHDTESAATQRAPGLMTQRARERRPNTESAWAQTQRARARRRERRTKSAGPRCRERWAPRQRSLTHRAPAPDALCVGPRRSLCRGPAISASVPGALQRSGPALFVSGPNTPSVSGLGALCVGARVSGPQLPSACHPSALRAPSSDPRATHPMPRHQCATHPARRVPFFRENPKPYCLGEKLKTLPLFYATRCSAITYLLGGFCRSFLGSIAQCYHLSCR